MHYAQNKHTHRSPVLGDRWGKSGSLGLLRQGCLPVEALCVVTDTLRSAPGNFYQKKQDGTTTKPGPITMAARKMVALRESSLVDMGMPLLSGSPSADRFLSHFLISELIFSGLYCGLINVCVLGSQHLTLGLSFATSLQTDHPSLLSGLPKAQVMGGVSWPGLRKCYPLPWLFCWTP